MEIAEKHRDKAAFRDYILYLMQELLAKYKGLLICIVLAGSILAAYHRVLTNSFVSFDDGDYVTDNRHIRTGFSVENVRRAFSMGKVAYWHPLTWLSHMLDCQLYGLRPGLHHLTSLIIHIANSLLLFVVFKAMTGAGWSSAYVAAVFALHPINVDSVAWVSERKSVLSTLFWLLTMLTYASYARRGPGSRGRAGRYLLALVLFALGLLAKPTLVTLPAVCLLLDYWPLGRIRLRQPKRKADGLATAGSRTSPVLCCGISLPRLILEKIPFFVLSGISVFLSYLSVKRIGVTTSAELIPMRLRMASALVSYVRYIGKIVCPRKLAVFYPYPTEVALWQSAGALLLLICASVVLLWVLRKKAYAGVGWLWFIGTLVPVIGLVQAGLWPAIADRWAYVPLIGLAVIVAWGAGDIVTRWCLPAYMPALPAGMCLLILMLCTYRQVGYWRNSRTLFEHALEVTTGNYIAHLNFGNTLLKDDKRAEAMSHYEKAVEIHPGYADAHHNLGVVLGMQDKHEQAIEQFRIALQVKNDHFEARLHLADALTRTGKLGEAISHYEKVMQVEPDNPEVLNNFALALVDNKNVSRAVELYNNALKINPNSFEVLNNLGNALVEQGKLDLALVCIRKALSLKPDFIKTYYNLGNALRRAGQVDEAAGYYQQALQQDPNNKDGHYELGLILMQQKKYDPAAMHLQRAIQLDPDFARAYYNLGLIFAEEKEIDKAIAQFRQVLRIYPNDAEMHCNVGTLLQQQGRLDEAIEEFRTALRLDPNMLRAAEQLKAALAGKSASSSP